MTLAPASRLATAEEDRTYAAVEAAVRAARRPAPSEHPANAQRVSEADLGGPEEPQDLFEAQSPPRLDLESSLPEVLREFASARAGAAGHDPTAYAYAAVAAAASVIPHETTLAMSSTWQEPLLQWVALVGPTGSGKTPAMVSAAEPVIRLHQRQDREYEAMLADQAHAKAQGRIKRGGYYFTDPTIDALIDRAANSQHTVLRHADEGTSWLNAMGRYQSSDKGERGIWLASWNGKPYTVTRIERGDATLTAWSVGLLYGITPGKMKEAYTEAAGDGVLARTLICLTSPGQWIQATPEPGIDRISQSYYDAVFRLAEQRRSMAMSERATERWRCLQIFYKETAQAIGDMAPGLAGFLIKAPTMTARLAGLFALVEGAVLVTDGSMERAERFMQHAAATANIAHQEVFAVSQPVAIARRLACRILTSGGERITRREFSRVDAFTKATAADQAAAINYLAGAGWLTEADGKRQRIGPRFHEATAWQVNPLVYERFADIAERERAKAEDAVARMNKLSGRAA